MKTLCVMLLSLLSILLQSIPIKAAQAITTQTAAIPSFKDYVDQHRKKRTATCTPRHLEQDVCSSPLI